MEASVPPIIPRRLIIGLATFSLVSGVALLLFGLSFLKEANASKHWPIAQGTIQDVTINRVRVTDSRPAAYTYTYTVTYAYEVEGNRHRGDRYSLGSGSTASRTHRERQAAVEAAQEAYSIGQSIQVYYNPDAPDQAVIQSGANVGTFVPLIFGIVLFFSGVGLFIFAQRVALR